MIKKIKSIIIFILLLLSSAPDNKMYFASASDETTSIESTFLGKFAVTERVEERKKIYIPLNLVSFYESTGRTIERERDIYIPPIVGTASIVHPPIGPSYRYYYYTIPNSLYGEVTQVVDLYNNIESLIYMLKYLENAVWVYNYMYGVRNSVDVNEILGYIRFFNNAYTGNKYSYICGDFNPLFASFVNSDASCGTKAKEFFASFVPNSAEINQLHGEIETLNREIPFIDPFNNTQSIDLIHMFASIDGIYYGTGYNSLINGKITNGRQRDIISWLGDLQYACTEYSKLLAWEDGYPLLTMESIMTTDGLGCPINDVLADIDAFNISYDFLSNCLLSERFEEYYFNNFEENRSEIFVEILDSRYESNFGRLNNENVKEFIYRCLGIEWALDGSYADVEIGFNNFLDYYFLCDGEQYSFLNIIFVDSGDYVPTLELRKKFAECFYEYLVS